MNLYYFPIYDLLCHFLKVKLMVRFGLMASVVYNRRQNSEYNKALVKNIINKMDSGPFRSDSFDEEFFAY